jgi:hypothetical protein
MDFVEKLCQNVALFHFFPPPKMRRDAKKTGRDGNFAARVSLQTSRDGQQTPFVALQTARVN